MLISVQRVFTILAVALWFGGFTFYTACVVRVGSKVVGGLTQGYITKQVTEVLEILAAIMAVGVALDIATSWKSVGRWMRISQCTAWLTMAGSTVGIIFIHHNMNALLDASTMAKPNHDLFSPFHQAYQFISTCLWIATVAYVVMMVSNYQRRTSSHPASPN